MSPVDIFYHNLDTYEDEFEKSFNVDKPKRGRPKKRKVYFTTVTEKAIVAYNSESCKRKKDRIFKEHINYPLFKLSENIINTFKFPYMDGTVDEIQHEVVCFLLQKLNKYSEDKGRAFSYFSIIAKNYLIQNNTKKYKERMIKTSLDNVDQTYLEENFTDTFEIDPDNTFDKQRESFIDNFISEYENLVEQKFDNQRDVNIAYSVLELFKSRIDIETYNKKALYIMIREMTDTKTEYITKVVTVIKSDFNDYYEEFLSNLDS